MSPLLSTRPQRHLQLPDFCTPRALLLVLTIVSLTALLLTLAASGFDTGFLGSLARKLLFLLWTGLAGAALLCAARAPIARRTALAGSVLVIGLVVILVAAVSELAYRMLANPAWNPYQLLGPPPASHDIFIARNLAITVIVTAAALRYIYVAQQWRYNVEAQARSRVDALQARIRPHFLYNSMNTIASLTRSDPARAEEAVQDLSDLFRANLDERRSLVPLREELESARIYQRIEALRMGERLKVRWDVQELPPEALVPALTVQPLLENAIGHGVEHLDEGGEVIVEGTSAGGMVVLRVRNPLPLDDPRAAAGHGIALDNIRERLALLYGPRASVSAGREGDEFVVQLRFPEITTLPEPEA
jgi:two-component system sensor histidine kinase AlgZ